MIRIKDFAELENVTYEAARQQIKRYEIELQEHLVKQGRTTYLDEYAVEFLKSKRKDSPIIVQQQDTNEMIQQLNNENKMLLVKVAAQADKIAELSEWKANQAAQMIEVEEQKLLVNRFSEENEMLKKEINQYKEERSAFENKHNEVVRFIAERYTEMMDENDEKVKLLQEQLEKEKTKTWWDKLLGR